MAIKITNSVSRNIFTIFTKKRNIFTSRRRSPLFSSAASSSSPSITHLAPLSAFGYSRSFILLPTKLGFLKPFGLNSVQFRVNWPGKPFTPGIGDWTVTSRGPLYPGLDYWHWLIIVDKPGKCSNKQQMADCYVQTLAKVLGSEKEAKEKIYSVSCEGYFGFGCEVSMKAAYELKGLPDVQCVLPDSLVGPDYKDYGGELFVNGEIVQRPAEKCPGE